MTRLLHSDIIPAHSDQPELAGVMRRREFITLVSGAAAWPAVARAQAERVRRIGVLMNLASDDPEGQARNAALLQGLQELGWTVGRNVRIDYRWGVGDADRNRRYAADLVALAPDVILAVGGSIEPLQRATRTVPLVFVGVIDPVGRGLVANLARPGGNTTGFTPFEFAIGGKWLELLKQIAPRVTRALIIRDPVVAGMGQFGALQAIASSFGMELSPADARDADEIERAITAYADGANGGLVVPLSAPAQSHRDLIITLAARHRFPAIYAYRVFAADGGLVSYGPDPIDQYRRAAGYIDRILKGEKPGNLPVQNPTKYETVINLKTAKALGLTVPPTLLALADEVIE
jgi:putative ABC transport system substrate-binding protein